MKRLITYMFLLILPVSCGRSREEKTYKVEVKTADFVFIAPSEIPSGWITFVLNNENAKHIHEISISKLPDGIGYPEYKIKFEGSWAKILKELQDSVIDASGIYAREKELLPDWADQVQYITSRGLLSPGHKAEKTIYLEPGQYAMECWVKTTDGYIHVSKGMTLPLTVTGKSAKSSEPERDEIITITKDKIETDWNPGLGKHSFAVHLEVDSTGMPIHNNINLIKLDDSTNLVEINKWLDWYHIGGLRSPAPAEFLGGLSTYHSKVGQRAEYFTVYLKEPGRYAWIVEVPDGQELWKTFTLKI